MAEIALPKLDAERATRIAQSDRWTAISRIASIFAAAVTTLLLAPLIIWGFTTIQQSALTLNSHSNDIGTIKQDVAAIKQQDGQDHDWLTTLRSEVEGPNGLIVQITKLWQRPAQPNNRPQP